jgi:hypothetical protein
MAMLSIERPEQTANDGALTHDAKPACTALVPMVPSLQWSQPAHLQQPDSTFVTQLIATAEQVPQTRALRRATLADAQSAYSANRYRTVGAGIQTRQTI